MSNLPWEIIGGLLTAAFLFAGTFVLRNRGDLPGGRARLRRQRDEARSTLDAARERVLALEREREIATMYLTHLRDVAQSVRRAHGEPGARIPERVRRDILEPIRGYIPTTPGEQLKITWFRPNADRELYMFCQIGHDEEVEQTLRIPVGAGVAGAAFQNRSVISLPDMTSDPRFQMIPGGENQGSIICAAILRNRNEATGVLSVLSTRNDAFDVLEVEYVNALAACIAAMEPLEH